MTNNFVSKKISFFYLQLLLLVVFLSGCTTTTLPPAELSEASIRLSSLNHNKLSLEINSELSGTRLGWQYILMFIPFGEIEADRLKDFVFNRAFCKLSLAGYNVQPPWEVSPYTVVLTIKEADLNAYDLIALRNVSGSVILDLKVLDEAQQVVFQTELNSSDNAWREFAFLPQLNYVFTRTVDSAIDKVVEQLKNM